MVLRAGTKELPSTYLHASGCKSRRPVAEIQWKGEYLFGITLVCKDQILRKQEEAGEGVESFYGTLSADRRGPLQGFA